MAFKKKSTKELVQGAVDDAPERRTVSRTKEKRAKTDRETSGKFDTAFFRTNTFYGIIAIVAGLAIALLGVPILRSQTTDTVDVVCFASDVSAGSIITSSDVQVVEVSSYHLPVGTVFDASFAVGKYLRTDALVGDYVTSQRLSQEYPGDDPFLIDLPEGKMAISVSLPDLSQSVSGKLRAGDVVQIFASDANAETSTAEAPLELQYVEVLAATYRDGQDVSDGEAAKTTATGDDDTLSTVTLLVNAQQAAKIAGLEKQATMYAALVIRGNEARKVEALAAQDNYFVELAEAEAALKAELEAEQSEQEIAPEGESTGEPVEGTAGQETHEGGD